MIWEDPKDELTFAWGSVRHAYTKLINANHTYGEYYTAKASMDAAIERTEKAIHSILESLQR